MGSVIWRDIEILRHTWIRIITEYSTEKKRFPLYQTNMCRRSYWWLGAIWKYCSLALSTAYNPRYGNLRNGISPDSKVHGGKIGPSWDQQDPGEPHVGPVNFAFLVNIEMAPRKIYLISQFWSVGFCCMIRLLVVTYPLVTCRSHCTAFNTGIVILPFKSQRG